MKPIYIKFNTDRNEKFQIETTIMKNEKEKFVVKRALNLESKEHLLQMESTYHVLNDLYKDCEICAPIAKKDVLIFRFVKGISIRDRYVSAIQKNSIDAFWEVFNLQYNIITNYMKENECVFRSCDKYVSIFGDDDFFEGKEGLKVSNFEATCGNIILEEYTELPVFIDYEWVFNFPVPRSVFLYQCMIKANISSINDFIKFSSVDEMKDRLNIFESTENLEKTWSNYSDFVAFGKKEDSLYYHMSNVYLKNINNIEYFLKQYQLKESHIRQLEAFNHELTLEYSEKEKALQGNWRECAENWELSQKELIHVRQEWEVCAENWDACEQELMKTKMEWGNCAASWKSCSKDLDEERNDKKKMEESMRRIIESEKSLNAELQFEKEALKKEIDEIKNTKLYKILYSKKNKGERR